MHTVPHKIGFLHRFQKFSFCIAVFSVLLGCLILFGYGSQYRDALFDLQFRISLMIGFMVILFGLLAFFNTTLLKRLEKQDMLIKQELLGLEATKRDILDRKNAEQETFQRNESLEQKVREQTAQLETLNRELEAFSYSVSHDLRAPLRSIDGFSKIILASYSENLDSEARQYFQYICENAARMGQLIDDLLQLSRLSRSELHQESFNISTMAQEILQHLQEREPQRHVSLNVTPDLTAKGDPHLMKVVLENLLGNAWKFSGLQENAVIEFGLAQNNGGPAAFYVKDNGTGFDMTYADKLFGAFQRLHKMTEYPGTGIGLATVQRIIHRHGGKIWPQAEVNKGATFYFSLSEQN